MKSIIPSIPSSWLSDHLFVLVGGNPLPNFVAANLLLEENGTLHLVHTTGTTSIAKQIGDNFPKCISHEIVDPSNANGIERVLENILSKIKDGSIGLHYTGGTKAMSVHAHRVFRKVLAQRREKGVFTYLNAGNLSMHRDGVEEPILVQFGVTPQIETLLELHGIKLVNDPQRQALHLELGQALAEAHQTPTGQNAYDRWCQQYLRCPGERASERNCRNTIEYVLDLVNNAELDVPFAKIYAALRSSRCCEGSLVRSLKQFPQSPIPFPVDPVLIKVADTMRSTFGVDEETFDPEVISENGQSGFSSIRALVAYLDGMWVEHLTLSVFQAVMEDCCLHDCAMSLDTKETEDMPYNFEFDVAAMQGYQLFAVSCTRSNQRWLNKSKLFEAHVRATQLGGDESRVGLVCCEKAPDVLEQQVTRLWGTTEGRFKVFGQQDLPFLENRFRQWLSC